MDAVLRHPREELFDLKNDPQELQNLANDPRHQATLGELRARLRAWQEKTEDPWLVKYQHE